jgi:hypothetical protein
MRWSLFPARIAFAGRLLLSQPSHALDLAVQTEVLGLYIADDYGNPRHRNQTAGNDIS